MLNHLVSVVCLLRRHGHLLAAVNLLGISVRVVHDSDRCCHEHSFLLGVVAPISSKFYSSGWGLQVLLALGSAETVNVLDL